MADTTVLQLLARIGELDMVRIQLERTVAEKNARIAELETAIRNQNGHSESSTEAVETMEAMG